MLNKTIGPLLSHCTMEPKQAITVNISTAPEVMQQFAAAKHRIKMLRNELKLQSQLLAQLMPEVIPVLSNISSFSYVSNNESELHTYGNDSSFRLVNSTRKENLSKKVLFTLLHGFFTIKFGGVQEAESIKTFTAEACEYISEQRSTVTMPTVVPASRKRQRVIRDDV